MILHPNFEKKRIQGRYFMAIWFSNKVDSMICIGRHVGEHTTLALQHGGQNYFLILSRAIIDSYA